MVTNLHLIFGSYSFCWIFLEKGVDQVFAVVRRINFGCVKEKLTIDDILEHFFMVSIVKWRGTVDHLEE